MRKSNFYLIVLFFISIAFVSCQNSSEQAADIIQEDTSAFELDVNQIPIYDSTFTFDSVYKHVKKIDKKTVLIASNYNSSEIIIVDKFYAGFACDGPDFYLIKISDNNSDTVLYHFPCHYNQHNIDTFINQTGNTILNWMKKYQMSPFKDSVIKLSKHDLHEQYAFRGEYIEDRNPISNEKYIKKYTLLRSSMVLKTIESKIENNILTEEINSIEIKGYFFSKTKQVLLIIKAHLTAWEESQKKYFYILTEI